MTESQESPSTLRTLRRAMGRVPILGPVLRAAWMAMHGQRFTSSGDYWEARYAAGGNSGAGSYGKLARWKADVLNGLVTELGVTSLIEFGCGDGAQLALATYPAYTGIDVSPSAVRRCIERFRGDDTKSFFAIDPRAMTDPLGLLRADMALSLDVLYHLVEDDVWDAYLRQLFRSGQRYVVIFSSNGPVPMAGGAHERHRAFTPWVEANAREWKLLRQVANPYPMSSVGDTDTETSPADFFIYTRAT